MVLQSLPKYLSDGGLHWFFSSLFLATDKLALKGTEQKFRVEMEIEILPIG